MPRLNFAANLTTLFADLPFPDRFAAAREAGFEHVEFLFPYEWPLDLLARRIEHEGQKVALINAPAGDWDAGERGLAALPGREAEFRESIAEALGAARALNVPRVHVMAGLVPAGATRRELRATYHENLRYAAQEAGAHGIEVMIEPLNGHDVPGYFLDSFSAAAHTIGELRELGVQVRLQFDIYHCARLHGDVTPWLAALAHEIGHYQIAGTPGRHEPSLGDLPYQHILQDAAHLTPGLTVGLEYHPQGATEEGLGWLAGLETLKASA
ncbi:MAG: TIM barrel protein [Pseudomonadota bacterium]